VTHISTTRASPRDETTGSIGVDGMTANANRKTETPSRGPLDSWLIPSICKKPRSPGQSPRKNASPRPIAHALPLRPPDPRRVLPSSPPTPPAPKPNKLTALTLKGELLVAAILAGAKRCENRSWQIAPGWYALHLGYGQPTEAEENSWRKHWRASEGANPPVPPGIGARLPRRGSIVGAICIGENTKVVSAAAASVGHGGWGDGGWAHGPRVHRIKHVVALKQPVTGVKGKLSTWSVVDESTAGEVAAKAVCDAIAEFTG